MEVRPFFDINTTHRKYIYMYQPSVPLLSAIPREFCEWETFTPECGSDQVVLINDAKYGRMTHGTCITETVKIGCYHDVTSIARRKCAGRRTCDVPIPDRDFEAYEPCGEMENYFSVDYSCVSGEYSRLSRSTNNLNPKIWDLVGGPSCCWFCCKVEIPKSWEAKICCQTLFLLNLKVDPIQSDWTCVISFSSWTGSGPSILHSVWPHTN